MARYAAPETVEQSGGDAVNAPAADPWGGAPPPGTVEQHEEAPPLIDDPDPNGPSPIEQVVLLASATAIIDQEGDSLFVTDGAGPPTGDFLDYDQANLNNLTKGSMQNEAQIPGAAAARDAVAPAEATAADDSILKFPEAAVDVFISKEQMDIFKEHLRDYHEGRLSNNTGASSEPVGPVGEAIEDDTHPINKAAKATADAAADVVKDKGEAVEELVEDVGGTLEDVVEALPFVGDDIGDATDFAENLLGNLFSGDGAAEAAGEAVGDVGEPSANFVESIPIIGDELGDARDVVEDVIDEEVL